MIAGASNAVNLTDGLDGLAAGCCAIVLLAYTAITFITNEQENLALLSACPSSAAASASSGSTRSRPRSSWATPAPSSLEGAIGAIAVMTQTEILLIIIGGIFVIEAIGRAGGRRLQALPPAGPADGPIHHHFELLAWSETKIMLRSDIAGVCSGIGFTLYQQSIGP